MKARAKSRCISSLGVLLLTAAPLSIAGCGKEQPTAVFDATVLLERYEQDRRRHDPHAYSEVDLGEFTVTWREKPKDVGQGTSTFAPPPVPHEAKPSEPAVAPPPDPHKVEHGASAVAPPPVPHEAKPSEPTVAPPPEPNKVDQGATAVAPPPEPHKVDQGASAATPPPEPAALLIRFHLYGVVADGHLEEFSRLLETHGERVRSQVREAVQSSQRSQLDDPTLGWLKSELIQSINQSLQAPILRDAVFGEFALERG